VEREYKAGPAGRQTAARHGVKTVYRSIAATNSTAGWTAVTCGLILQFRATKTAGFRAINTRCRRDREERCKH